MNHVTTLRIAIVLLAVGTNGYGQADFYVSKEGFDDWSGTVAVQIPKDANTDYNIYFCAEDSQLGKEMIDKQQRDGVDDNSRSDDPMFVDPVNDDFRFKPDSPALKLGIVPIDLTKIGLREEP